MGSVFMPADYVYDPVTKSDIEIASIAWGFTLGFSFLTSVTAGKQTWRMWKKSKRVSTYIVLVWLEMLVSTIFGFICWFYLWGAFKPSFAFFFSILTLWALQVQFLLQIIINRIGLLIPDKRKVAYIKWGVAALITAINISVYNIWIPARLQINQDYIHTNEWWDRCEKAIYLVVDGVLNGYFLYLVNSKLLQTGMTKYRPLFRFNAAIICVSLSMDVLIIAMMSLKNTFVYMQFHPVAYIVKLKIEMTMAELIVKIAGSSNSAAPHNSRSGKQTSSTPNKSLTSHRRSGGKFGHNSIDDVGGDFFQLESRRYQAWCHTDKMEGIVEKEAYTNTSSQESEEDLKERERNIELGDDRNVIVRTFETRVTSESMNPSEAGGSETGSTVKLRT